MKRDDMIKILADIIDVYDTSQGYTASVYAAEDILVYLEQINPEVKEFLKLLIEDREII